MTELTIGTLAATYHLPPSALSARGRLDRAMAAAFEEALPLALARRGIDPQDGEICLREVRIPVRVRLSSGDGALALDWSAAAADAIAGAIAAGGDGVALRFASRRQALADFAAAVASGDRRRTWAYAQLGLCRETAGGSPADAADDLARALAGEPEAIVPVLAGLAQCGLLAGLVARIHAPCWPALASRALAAAGAAAAIPALAIQAEGRTAERATAPEIASRIARALARSAIIAALPSPPAAGKSAELRTAFVALSLIETDPGLLLREDAAAALTLAAGQASPAGWKNAEALREEGVGWQEAPAPRRASVSGDVHPAPDEPAAWPARLAAWTDWGGLLFLLIPLAELGIPGEIAASPLLSARPFRWSLHRLALALAPLAEDDPAALAFAGLGPTALPPSSGEPPASPEESERFAGLAVRLAAEVAGRLGEPELGANALLDRVCRRRAEILADPGWIEVRLSLSDVATELRRAGLDLDPGYLPFLGTVVRFVYV